MLRKHLKERKRWRKRQLRAWKKIGDTTVFTQFFPASTRLDAKKLEAIRLIRELTQEKFNE
jgi:hypothetical protein